jgi:hypothetical protein
LSASHTFPDGTLALGNTSSGTAYAQFGSDALGGEWVLRPLSTVPLPGALGLLLSGLAAVRICLMKHEA